MTGYIQDPFSIAQIVGYLAMLLGIVALLQHCDMKVRLILALSTVALALHFILLGNPTAAAIATLSASRSGLSMFHGMRKKAYFLVPFYISTTIIVTFFTYEQWFDLFPVLSTCVGTYAFFYWQSPKLRYSFIFGSCLWLTHNILAHSYGPIIMELSLIAANVWRLCHRKDGMAIHREHTYKKQET